MTRDDESITRCGRTRQMTRKRQRPDFKRLYKTSNDYARREKAQKQTHNKNAKTIYKRQDKTRRPYNRQDKKREDHSTDKTKREDHIPKDKTKREDHLQKTRQNAKTIQKTRQKRPSSTPISSRPRRQNLGLSRADGSNCQPHGSVAPLGIGRTSLGSRVKGQGSRVKGQGSREGSRVKGQGSKGPG